MNAASMQLPYQTYVSKHTKQLVNASLARSILCDWPLRLAKLHVLRNGGQSARAPSFHRLGGHAALMLAAGH